MIGKGAADHGRVTDSLGFSLAQLRYFVVSAELGNITEAADKLCASQSTVSSAVMRLERQLGVQLLLRHRSRGVTLTPSGRHLLYEARALLRQAGNIKAQGEALGSDTAGRLDVGFFFPVAPLLLPAAYRITQERHARLQLNVHEESAERLLENLGDGQYELVVTFGFLSGESRFRPLADLPVHALVAENDPLGRAGPVRLADLAARPLITLDSPAVARHFEKLYADVGTRPARVIPAASLETLRGLVAAGCGVALMYQRAANMATLDGGRLRAVEIIGATTAALGVATVPDALMSSRAVAFLGALRSAVAVSYEADSRAS